MVMESREPSASFSEHRSRVVVDFSTFSLLPENIPYGQATFRLSIVSWWPFGAFSLLGRGDDPAVRLHVHICVDRCVHSLGGTAGSGAGARGDSVFKHLGKRSAAHFAFPPAVQERSSFSASSLTLAVVRLFGSLRPPGCGVCGSHLRPPGGCRC